MLEINKIHNMDCVEGLKQLDDNSIDLIITDPPYEVNYNEKSMQLEKLGKARTKQIERDASFVDQIYDYDLLAKEWYRILKDNTHIYIFCGDKQIIKWITSMNNVGFKNYQILVWLKDKSTFDMSYGHRFIENKEFILFFHKGYKKLNGYNIDRSSFRSVLKFNSSDDTDIHSCAKPINLIEFLTKLSSNEGDVCLDCFSGSGNHLIAFKNCNRRYIGFELSKEYTEAINKRLNLLVVNNWF